MKIKGNKSVENDLSNPLTTVDDKGKNAPQQLILSSEKMRQLISLVEIERAENSPIPDRITPLPAIMGVMNELTKAGWVVVAGERQTPEINDQAEKTLQALLSPNTNMRLILGSSKEIAFTELFSAESFSDNELVIYTFREEDDIHVISPGQSPSDISDALLVQLLNGPQLDGLNFELDFEKIDLLVYLVVLDMIYTRQLQAKLEADNFPIFYFTAQDLWHRFSQLRIGEDMLWCSVLFPILFPYLHSPIKEKNIKSILSALADKGLITPVDKKGFQPTEFTQTLSEGILPIVSFASFAMNTQDGEGMHFGFCIGLSVNLVVQAFLEEERTRFILKGMNGIQLSRFLFEIGLPASSDEKGAE